MRAISFWTGFGLTAAGALTVLARSEPLAFLVDLEFWGSGLVLAGLLLLMFGLWRRWSRLRGGVLAVALVLAGLFVASTFLAYRKEEVRFRNGDVALAGTLFVPRGEGPHPAVVLLHGSSPAFSTRAPYRLFAEFFARRGIAALVYDKRGFGASGGGLPFDYDDLAGDAVAAFRALQARPEIGPVGLWGISEGGWTAPLAASRVPDAAFLLVVSGGGVPPHRTVQWDMEGRLREAGYPRAVVDRALALQKGVDEQFRGGADGWAALLAARNEPWFETAFGMDPDEVPASADDLETDRADYRRVLDFSALPLLRELEMPMLFLFGADDTAIPAAESARAIRALGLPHARVEVYPGADHVLMTPSGRFAPGFLDRMAAWMRARKR